MIMWFIDMAFLNVKESYRTKVATVTGYLKIGLNNFQNDSDAPDWGIVLPTCELYLLGENILIKCSYDNIYNGSEFDEETLITTNNGVICVYISQYVIVDSVETWLLCYKMYNIINRTKSYEINDISLSGTIEVPITITVTQDVNLIGEYSKVSANPWRPGQNSPENALNVFDINTISLQEMVTHAKVEVNIDGEYKSIEHNYDTPTHIVLGNFLEIDVAAVPALYGTLYYQLLEEENYQIFFQDYGSYYKGTYNTPNTTWASLTYTTSYRTPCSIEKNMSFDQDVNYPGYYDAQGCHVVDSIYHQEITIGNGKFILIGGYANAAISTGTGLDAINYAQANFREDYGSQSNPISINVKGMFGNTISGWTLFGVDKNYNITSLPAADITFFSSEYEDTVHCNYNVNTYTPTEGNLNNYATPGLISYRTWLQGNIPYIYEGFAPAWDGNDWYETHGDFTLEDVYELRQPAHRHPPADSWTPLPGTEYYDPQYEEWIDRYIYMSNTIPELNIADAIKINLHAEGDVATPLQFKDLSITDWTKHNCNAIIESDKLKVSPTASDPFIEIGYETFLPNYNIRLTGTRYAKIYWTCDVPEAEFEIYIGRNSWIIKDDGLNLGYSIIDLCVPSGFKHIINPTQSIVDVEKPLDGSIYPRTRNIVTEFDWDTTAGFGVGRISGIKILPLTADTIYYFDKITLFRKTIAEGGFVKLLVTPSDVWNDSRYVGTDEASSLDNDFAFRWEGNLLLDPDYHKDEIHFVRKAILIVDGAPVFELKCGHIYVDDYYKDEETSPPYYIGTPQVILKDDVTVLIGYPWHDYYNPDTTDYDVNGIFTISQNFSDKSDFLRENSFVGWLVPGIYEPINDIITIPFNPRVCRFVCDYGSGLLGSFILEKLFNGSVCGIAVDKDYKLIENGSVEITTIDGKVTVSTNKLGWFMKNDLFTQLPIFIDKA